LRGLLSARLDPPGAPSRDFDVVVDAAGGRDDASLNTALNLVRDGGTVVVQTAYDPGVRLNRDLRPTFRRSLTIAGAFSYCHRSGRGDFAMALDILAGRPGWADPLTGARFALGDLPEALASVTGRRAHRPIKAVLTGEGARL
jgi:threonine dehydrogenase-like Zn-dependent dehydrogenase